MKSISSNLTFYLKYIYPLIAIFLLIFLSIKSYNARGYILPELCILIFIIILHYSFCYFQIKRVYFQNEKLYYSNYIKRKNISIENIIDLEESFFLTYSIIKISFKEKNNRINKIHFISNLWVYPKIINEQESDEFKRFKSIIGILKKRNPSFN